MSETQERSITKPTKNGTGFAVGGILAMLITTASTAMYPSYSSRNDAISYLGGAGVPTEIFWDLSIMIVGVLWLWSTYLLFRKSSRKFSSILFYLAGTGFLLVGLSPWNQSPTTHYLGANLIFLFGALNAVAASRMTYGTMAKISLVAGLISILAYISGCVGSYYILGSGGVERMIFYPIILWQIAFGGYLLNDSGIRAGQNGKIPEEVIG